MGKKIFDLSFVFLIILALALILPIVSAGSWTQDVNQGLVASFNLEDNTNNNNITDNLFLNNGTLFNYVNNLSSENSVLAKNNRGIFFDAVDDYISIPATLATHNMTMCAWFNWTGGTTRGIIGNNMNVRNSISIVLSKARWTSGSNSTIIQSGTLTASTWNHVCGVIFAINSTTNNLTMYTNGGSNGNVQSLDSTTNQTALRIGDFGTGGQSFNGTIDEVLFYNRTLSAAEVSNIYTNSRYYNALSCTAPSINNNWAITFQHLCHPDQNINLGSGNYILNGSSGTFLINANSNFTAHGSQLSCSSAGCQSVLNYGSKIILT